jgi:hypothetical protein
MSCVPILLRSQDSLPCFDLCRDTRCNTDLSRYNPKQTVYPIPERDDLEVDWELRPNGVPLYVFAVRDYTKARLTTLSCLEFQRAQLRYKSIVVHEDFSKLGRKDVTRLTSACDKQFTNLDDFKQNAIQYLEREIHP